MENNDQPGNLPKQEPFYPPPPYQPPYPNEPFRDDRPLTLGNYLVLMIVGAIPVVGLIMMLVWAFSGSSNTNRKNFARANLILTLIAVVLCFIFGTTFVSVLRSMGGSYYS
jgi:hypothetical protein